MTAAATKKQRDKEYQRKKRAQMKAQQEGTGDEENVVSSSRKANKRARTEDD